MCNGINLKLIAPDRLAAPVTALILTGFIFFMKQLEINIRKNGFDYQQVYRTDKGYIYSQKMNGKVIAFEVFRHLENKHFHTVSFPRDEAFGKWAWTYPTFELAKQKLNTL